MSYVIIHITVLNGYSCGKSFILDISRPRNGIPFDVRTVRVLFLETPERWPPSKPPANREIFQKSDIQMHC